MRGANHETDLSNEMGNGSTFNSIGSLKSGLLIERYFALWERDCNKNLPNRNICFLEKTMYENVINFVLLPAKGITIKKKKFLMLALLQLCKNTSINLDLIRSILNMKILVVFYCLLINLTIYSQVVDSFSKLKGFEDQYGHSQLFYKQNSVIDGITIQHFDVYKNSDEEFLHETHYKFDPSENIYIEGYDFWDNDPSKYIYWIIEWDNNLFRYSRIMRYDQLSYSAPSNGTFQKVSISNQNDSLLFSDLLGTSLSKDGGLNWSTLSDSNFFLSLYPYNDSTLFAFGNNVQPDYNLYKSTDRGKTFTEVDTTSYYLTNFHYDSDSIHIYIVYSDSHGSELSVSNKFGNALTWQRKYFSNNNIYISLDNSKSGTIYLANGKNIFISTNYGDTFNLFKQMKENIVGIYKKSGTDKLFAISSIRIYEISQDSIKILKDQVIPKSVFNWYPLSIGNRWFYQQINKSYSQIDSTNHYLIRTVTKDTTINNKHFFKVKNKQIDSTGTVIDYSYYRVDSTNAIIYRLNNPSNIYSQAIFLNLLATDGDTVWIDTVYHKQFQYISIDEPYTYWNAMIFYPKTISEGDNFNCKFTLLYGIGMSNTFNCDSSNYQNLELQGCIINGKEYGDTTIITGIDRNKGNSLNITNYRLFQNYPNPFNPSTVINYQLSSENYVVLRVYDSLGREITTLVSERQSAGLHQINFSSEKYKLSSGVYFVRMEVFNKSNQILYSQTKKLSLIK